MVQTSPKLSISLPCRNVTLGYDIVKLPEGLTTLEVQKVRKYGSRYLDLLL